MEERIAGYFVDVITFSIHTTFDLTKEEDIEVFMANSYLVPGVVDVTLKRYSLEFEAGFLFDIHSIKAAILDLFETFFEPSDIQKITTQDLAQRAAERQMESLEDIELDAATLPNLLMATSSDG
jgi:hypothetical protein